MVTGQTGVRKSGHTQVVSLDFQMLARDSSEWTLEFDHNILGAAVARFHCAAAHPVPKGANTDPQPDHAPEWKTRTAGYP